jgi:hypothetical protein
VAALALLLAVDFASVDMGAQEESALQQDQAEFRSGAESATSVAGAAQSPTPPAVAASAAGSDAQRQDNGASPEAAKDAGGEREEDFRLSVDESGSDALNGLRIAEIVLGAGAVALAAGWFVAASRRRQTK